MKRKHISAFGDGSGLWIWNRDVQVARLLGPTDYQVDNAAIIVSAWNACVEINAENPMAAAEAMPQMFRLILAVVVDARNICGKGKLDLEEWLKKAEAAVEKAMKEAA
jgi:hypothetical protein